MIGPLAEFVTASNSFKIVQSYFGKVYRKSNVCIIQFNWLIGIYLVLSLVRNASFLIVKSSCVRGRSQWRQQITVQNIFLVSLRLCISPLVCAPTQLTLFTSPTTPSTPRHMRGIQFRTLEILQSPDKFTVKRKTQINIYVYIYFVHHLQGKWHSYMNFDSSVL